MAEVDHITKELINIARKLEILHYVSMCDCKHIYTCCKHGTSGRAILRYFNNVLVRFLI